MAATDILSAPFVEMRAIRTDTRRSPNRADKLK
jgi:hypothetical protein